MESRFFIWFRRRFAMNTAPKIQSLRVLGPIILALLILVVPATLLADEPESLDDDARVIIIHDDGQEIVIEMEEINEIVADAMGGLDEMMENLEEMQLQVRLGQDNQLDLSFDDTTFELDLDQIMSQVSLALQAGFDEFDTDDWTGSHDRWDVSTEEDLRRELKDLKKEMKSLRRELKKIGDSLED